jgi:hypothetical protein
VSANIPSAAFTTGDSEVRLAVADAADNAFSVTIPLRAFGYDALSQVVEIPRLVPAEPSRPMVISASLDGSPGVRAHAKPGTVRGVLRDENGTAMPSASIEIASRPLLLGSTFAQAASVRTNAAGEFSWKVPRGPSREIKLTAASPGAMSIATVQVSVRAPLILRTNRVRTRNGKSIRFAGSIADTPRNARTRVELQAWANRWVPFANATVRNGRFSAKYRFKNTFRPATYRFRAVLPMDPNFPYAPATSKQVRVRVTP